jgi:hypothetical protein
VDVEIIHNQMNRVRLRIGHRQFEDDLGELDGRAVGSGEREVPPGLRLNGAEDVGRAASLILAVPPSLFSGRCR